jgi:large subunit ribosomal protein L9
MKVILKENIKSIGKKDEIVNVSDGYARNYLFAKKLAVEANNENLSKLKAKKDSENYKKDIEKQEAKKVAEELEKIKLQFKVKQGENGKIFGGISSKEIAEKLEKQQKIKVDKKKIELRESIKTLGITKVSIKLYEGVIGTIKVEVLPE